MWPLLAVSQVSGWIGVDLDGTLARHFGEGVDMIGDPVPAMVERVRAWLADGVEVRIMTARVSASPPARAPFEDDHQRQLIGAWCIRQFGRTLRVTCCKDYDMIALYDDRAVAVGMNTGELLSPAHDGDA